MVRLGGLGDLLVSFPSIHLIRKCYPSSLILLASQKKYGDLLQKTGIVDECLPQDARQMTCLFSGVLILGEKHSQWLRDIDRAVGWFQKRRSFSGLKTGLSSTGIGFSHFVYDEHCQETISRHFFQETQKFLHLKPAEGPRFEDSVCLPLSSIQKREGRELLGEMPAGLKDKIIVIHPGSGSQEKCWPLAHFLEVIQRLPQKNLRGVLVTGPAEEWLEKEIEESSLPENWVWLREPSLMRLAGLLSVSDFYLGNDSGVTHLAASCGTTGLALFRKDLEKAWRPYGRISVLSESAVQEISFDRVWTAIKARLWRRKLLKID